MRRYFTKLDQYILRKYFGTFFFILLIIIAVAVVIDVAEKMEDFTDKNKNVPLQGLVLSYYPNFCLFFGNLLSPLIIFLTVLFFTSRMTQKTEIVAILSGGVSFYRLMVPYLFASLLMAGISFWLNAYIVPTANEERIQFEYNHMRVKIVMQDLHIHKKVWKSKIDGHETFVHFFDFNQFEEKGTWFTMKKYNFNDSLNRRDIVARIDAKEAQWVDSTESWRLGKAYVRNFSQDGKESLEFRSVIDTTMLLTPADIFILDMPAERMSLDRLIKFISIERDRGSDILPELEIELMERFAYPFASIILTFIGVAVSTKKRRGGTALMMGVGLILSFVYVTLIIAGQAMLPAEIPAWIKVWSPNAIFAGVAIFLIRVAPK